MTTGGGKKRDDSLLLIALASGQTIQTAAQTAGVSERTASRRMRDPAFRRRLADIRGQMLSRAAGKLAEVAAGAVDCLQQLLLANSEAIRLGASRAVLELAVRLRESEEFAMRLAALEQQLLGPAGSADGLGVPPGSSVIGPPTAGDEACGINAPGNSGFGNVRNAADFQ